MGGTNPQTLETQGRLTGLDVEGTFHAWHDGQNDRFDQKLGVRLERTIRVGDREYVINSNGDVRMLVGSLVRRQVTQDFIASDDLVAKPQYSTLLGRSVLPDGRTVVQVQVAPPGGDVEVVSFDGVTQMIDRVAFTDSDGIETLDYSDYRVVDNALVPFVEVDSDGDHQYDVTQHVLAVSVDKPISPDVFVPPPNRTVATDTPVTVKMSYLNGHYYVPVGIHGKTYTFLVDTGAQGVVIDSRIAAQLVLIPEGLLQVRGAKRVDAVGVASLDSIDVAGVDLPLGEVSIVNLNESTNGAFPIDGVLGYPFFAAAEVRMDFDHLTMTFGKPGSLPVLGQRLDLDTDRELVEVATKINNTPTDCLIDTGNSGELLVFNPFVQAHPGTIQFAGAQQVSNFGVGGSMSAVGTYVDELDLGTFRLYNRFANIMLSQSGAFADRIDGGNIGVGTLHNFVTTFDVANRAMYLQPSFSFDDGRYRARGVETPPHP
jgi:predicted aspartyl protease